MRQRQRADGRLTTRRAVAFNGLNAAFNVYCTVSSASGYSVSATADQLADRSLQLGQRHLLRRTSRRTPAAGEQPLRHRPEQQQVRRPDQSLAHGDLTGLTNAKGYLVPLKLSAQDAVTSSGRGVVYLVIIPAEELFRKNFTVADITGALVADRSGWSITGGDYHSGSWPEVIDDSTDTFMASVGKPHHVYDNLRQRVRDDGTPHHGPHGQRIVSELPAQRHNHRIQSQRRRLHRTRTAASADGQSGEKRSLVLRRALRFAEDEVHPYHGIVRQQHGRRRLQHLRK